MYRNFLFQMKERLKDSLKTKVGVKELLNSVYEGLEKFFQLEECTAEVTKLIDMTLPDCRTHVHENHQSLRNGGYPIIVAGR